MKMVDVGGSVFMLNDEDKRYRYRFITDRHGWQILLRDDGYRIYSMYVSEKPTNTPLGQREWELLWEYKHSEAPGHAFIADLIMTEPKEGE